MPQSISPPPPLWRTWHLQLACGALLIVALGLAWLVENQQRIRLRADRFADPVAYPKDSFLNPNDSIAWWSD